MDQTLSRFDKHHLVLRGDLIYFYFIDLPLFLILNYQYLSFYDGQLMNEAANDLITAPQGQSQLFCYSNQTRLVTMQFHFLINTPLANHVFDFQL